MVRVAQQIPGEIGVRRQLGASAQRADRVLVLADLRIDGPERDPAVRQTRIERDRALEPTAARAREISAAPSMKFALS